WEYNFVRWLEREGYDVAYCTNVDAHADANFVRSRRAFLSVGHDEYWSWQMRENVEAARGRGVGLGFFSANTCYWQVRFEPGFNGAANRTMVGYKYAAPTEDPFATDTDGPNDRYVTTFWRDNPVKESEGALLGVMYTADPVDADIVIEDPAHWSLANTGLRAGDRLAGLLGYEVDKLLLDIPAGTQRVASSPFVKAGVTDYSHMVSYVHASGANVFSTGSIQWSWGLDDFNAPALRTSRLNWAAQHVTRNVLARLANRPEPPAPPPPPPTPTPTPMVVVFSDNFDDNARDASKWALGTIQGTLYSGPSASDLTVPALEQNGRLEITPLLNLPGDHYNGFVSAAAWDMTGGSASVEVVSAPTDGAVDTELAVCLDGQNFYMIVQESGRLYFQDIVAGARNSSAAAYNPAQQRFWRIRHDPVGDLVLFETSADRLAWVVQRTIPRSLPLASVKFELSAGTWRIETLTGTARFDNFRLEKPSTATPTPTPTPTSTPTPTPANKPPVANPGGPYSGTTGTAVQFDGTRSSDPDGTIASYTWNFGDGTTATGARPLKTYTTAGTYTVRLTVRDNLNASHSATTTATITIPPPNAPTALDATAISSSQIKLTWRDNSTGETGFKIERSTSSTGGFVQIATVGRGVTTYTNGGRASRTTYYYRVRAYGDGGNSAYTNVDGARTF
ncbi:MAG TPA: N,N-dimethylformamidase beta subunit family domain-containing protein, partial [Pyrinomonadaceae bacterium]|nr:N,N-dimethylformamidase beta subunit family domain-containing protein [Pyrinomonadaceae bacterium]